ncbi:MAG TPA: M23 family metallopeptidase [Longimicrobiales bacterium]|nr:M23 family metallopeptidase [Longimicrobiales bacterium]
MPTFPLRLAATLALVLTGVPAGANAQDAAPTSPSDSAALERGRSLTASFYGGELRTVWDAFTPAMKDVFGEFPAFQGFRQQIGDELGEEIAVLEENVVEDQGYRTYVRIAEFAEVDPAIAWRWTFDTDGSVAGLRYGRGEPAASEYEDYETRAEMRLPFRGTWSVAWGGRSLENNYHAAYPDQRYAYDFVVRQEGSTHRGDGSDNEDYYCFGRQVVAPGDGTVVAAVDGVPDQAPGEMNPNAPLGNHVIIDHGKDEISFLAHLENGSVGVEAGQEVEAGDPIGTCGNSGNSSEPHLHHHLQRDTEFHAGRGGEGLPLQYQDFVADGQPVERGEPTRGQQVRPEE